MSREDYYENNLKKIKIAAKVLEFFNSLHITKAYLAGGALRDWDNNKEIKDLDFFINEGYSFTTNAPKLFKKTLKKMNSPKDKGYGHPLIKEVYQGFIDKVEVNIIVTRCPPIAFIMNGFDFNICKIYMCNSDCTLVRTEEYLEDIKAKRITYSPTMENEPGRAYSVNIHLPRIAKKYPDFAYNVCLSI